MMEKVNRWLERHYRWLLVLILALASGLRFWHLGSVPHAYFDEINIPHFGFALLQSLRETPFMTAHPPLPHYLFAGAMALYYQLPWVEGGLPATWSAVDPVSYRWLTATLGVACCALAASIVRGLKAGAPVALLTALLVAIDGALVVDSRAGLNNIVMLSFGLAAVWCFVLAVADRLRWRYLLACGGLLGATVSVKWNGLGFWLLPSGLIGLAWVLSLLPATAVARPGSGTYTVDARLLLRCGVALALLPLAVYWLLWQPYLWHEQQWSFMEIHLRMRAFHTEQVGANDHPYCSAWYQWPYQGRPMSYFFERLALGAASGFKAIHLLGNPLLYPLGFLAAVGLSVRLGAQELRAWPRGEMGEGQTAFIACVVLGYWGNFLPWALVDRCLFAYHYEPASLFSFAALAWCLWWPWRAPAGHFVYGLRAASATALLAVVAAWLFWLPLALGTPLLRDAFYQRMWFSTWI